MAESGGSNSEVEVKVVFKADTSELDAAKKSLGGFDSAEGSGSSGLDETAEAAGEAEEKLEDLKEKTEEAAENLGALGENTETVGENLESLGEQADAAAQNLKDLSDNAEETGDNLSEAGEAAEDVGSVLEDLSDNAENAADQISAVGDAANDTADGVKEAGEAADQISEGFDSAGDAAEKAADNLQSAGDAAKDTADDLGSIGDSVGELSDSLLDISEAGEDAGDNLGSIGENAADAAGNLSVINDAVEDTSENLGGIGDAADDAADNVSKIGDAAGDAESSLGSLADNAGDAADQIGDIGSSGQDAADGVEDISDAADDAGGHFEKIISLLEEISQKLDSAGSAARTTGEEVKKAGDEAEKSVDTFKDFSEAIGKFESLGNSLKGFSNNLISIGKDAVATAGEFEQLKAKLETIQKSSETASQTFEYAKSLAASTPFDVKGVVNAAVQLEVYGQNSKELLPVVANLASAMGGDLSAAATAFGRALSGSSEGLQSLRDSFGVNTDKLVKFGAALNKQGGIAVDSAENVEKLKKALVDLVNTEFAGGIERQASTVAGAMANVEDAVTETKAAIGAEFAPYVVVASEHVGDLLEGLKGFAPVIAVVGGLAAATAGLAGTFITSAASAAALGVAIKALRGDYEQLNARIDAFKTKNAGVYSAGKLAGSIGGIVAALLLVKEVSDLVTEKIINDEKKVQAEIAAQSKELVRQRQEWDNLRASVEKTADVKIKYNSKDNTPNSISMSDAFAKMSDVELISTVGQDQIDEFHESVQQQKKDLEELRKKISETREEYEKTTKLLEGLRKKPVPLEPSAGVELGRQIKQAERQQSQLAQNLKEYESQEFNLSDRYKPQKEADERIQASFKYINRAQKTATAELAYADFAAKAKDAGALTDSIEGCRKALAGLYEAGKGRTVLSDAQLKDPTERLQRMGQLMRSGQENSTEFNYLKSIKDLEEKLKESYKTQKELRQQDLKDAEQAFNEQLSRERAGHEQSLDEERAYWETLLEARKGERQRLASAYETDLRRHKNGFNPGDQEYLQGEIDNLQHLSPGEIEAINKLHELDKKQAAESFSSLITPLREAADELSNKITAKPADQVAAWKLVVDKAKEWGQTNAQILAQSPELKKQFESDLKGVETEYKRVQEVAANTALINLSEKVSEKIGSVSSPTAQLEAVRESERLYQQTLRTSKELQASDAARQQAQKQLNSLKQQELKLIEQIKEIQKQVENETASLEVQIEEERLAALQDRANAGEDVSRQILAQEQKIQEMRLQQLEEAKKQELEMHADTSEESARLRLAIEKKYQDKIVLLNMQYQRKLAQEQRSFSDKQSKLKNRDGLKPESKKEETSWKPGSPLMTLQDMLNKHNQWFANAGSDFEDAATKTNTMSGAAENASDKLFKLAGSAEAAASGLAGSGGSAAAGSAGAGATDSAAFYASGFRYANSAALPSARDVYFPSAGQFGSTVHADRISESSINNVRNVNNSTYNVNFGNKATSVNAVDVSAITNRTARIVMQKINNQNRHNSIY